MRTGPIAVVAALEEEIEPLVRRLAGGRRERWPGLVCRRGALAGREAVLTVTGDGASAAARVAGTVCAELRPAALIGVGIAGGLSPDLPAGSLLAAGSVVAGGVSRTADRDWLARALATGRAVEGGLATVDRVLATVAAKRELWLRLGRPRRQGVDLESAAWAAAAEGRGVPWLVLRAIADPADEALPLPFDRLAAADGGVSRPRVLGHLALRPWRLPAVLELRRRLSDLAARLARLVEEVVR